MSLSNRNKKYRILVTGGTGYIGSHTAVELLNCGYDVVIADNLANSRPEVINAIHKITGKKTSFIKADLCNTGAVKKIFDGKRIDAVIHFAAFKAVGESVEQPLKYYRNNLLSLLNILELGMKAGLDKIVFSSSCSVYGEPDQLPVNESAPLKKPESPYGNTKQVSEQILADTAAALGLRVISLRYFNPVGAHPSALIGEYPLASPSNLVPVITQTAIGKRKSFTVFGNDYDTSDGSCIRDYIHVVDLAKAHVAALRRLFSPGNSRCEVFNLGTGKGHSVFEIINTFEKISGKKLPYKIGKRRPGDVVKVYADTRLANKKLKWYARHTLEEMLVSAWKWEQALAKNKIS